MLAVGEDIHQLAQVEVCGTARREYRPDGECNPADLLGPVGTGTPDLPRALSMKTTEPAIRRTAPNGLRHYQRDEKPDAFVGLIRRGSVASGIGLIVDAA